MVEILGELIKYIGSRNDEIEAGRLRIKGSEERIEENVRTLAVVSDLLGKWQAAEDEIEERRRFF